MSDLLQSKQAKFESLNERERKILDELMNNPSVVIREVCDRLGEPEQTVRGSLTSLYKKLGIPENERDKRGFLVREYQEAYQERYLRVGEVASSHQETPTITVLPRKSRYTPEEKLFIWLVILSVVTIFNFIMMLATTIQLQEHLR